MNFTVAVDNPMSRNGEKSTSFIPCTCWNKTAEAVSKYCAKGSLVGVDGRLNQRSYDDRNGQKRSVVEVIAGNVEFLDTRGSRNSAPSDQDRGYDPSYDSQPKTTAAADDDHEGIDGSDNDLPF